MICWLGRGMTEMGFSSFLSVVCSVSIAGAPPQTPGFFALVSRERLLAATHSISYFSPRQNTSAFRQLMSSLSPCYFGVQTRYAGVLLTLHLGDNINYKQKLPSSFGRQFLYLLLGCFKLLCIQLGDHFRCLVFS